MKKKRTLRRRTALIGWTLVCLVAGFGLAGLSGHGIYNDARASAGISDPPGSFSELAKKASPSVVNISTVKVMKGGRERQPSPFGGGPNDPFKDFYDRFFKDQMPKGHKQQSLGTGFVIDKEGHILTNNHVVEKTDEIKVRFGEGNEYEAKIIGRDPKTDLALIKIDADIPLEPLPLGDSESLEVGDWVIAIGNPFGLASTVTAGIVSAKYRQLGAGAYDNFIQTDASINPGNSGGPLLNTSGEVVGINSAIYTRSGGSIGIGFAIPVNMAKDLLPGLKEGKVVRGWLGVLIQEITADLKEKLKLKGLEGALVADVTRGGPADKADIKRGDVIVTFDGSEIKEMKDLPYIVAQTPVGKTVKVEVIRKGEKESLQVTIGKLDEEQVTPVVTEVAPNLGMTLKEITPDIARSFQLSETKGVVVVQVENDSPAAEARIRPGDVILEIDQNPIERISQFNEQVKNYKDGDTILFLIKRQTGTMYLTMKLTE